MPNTSPSQKNIVHGDITAGGNVHIGDYLVTYNHYFAAQEVKIPHRLTNNIPTNADHILGRASELEQAKGYLAQHQATILFNGIGGIGKTALASKFMALYGHEYQHLAWITVQSTLADAFTNNAPLLASLHITQQVQEYITTKQLYKAFEYLFHQLNLLERTLVVIDNANDLDDLEQYKNWFDTANCHFLITSRNQPSEWASVEVDSLHEDEAVVLFRKLHPTVSVEDEVIKDLLSKLFYHTLLIELVAKAGAITGIPFSDLQSMIEARFIHHESLNQSLVPTGRHGSVVPNNVKKARIEDYIWLIFSQVKGLNDNSKDLLKAMALLPVATPFDLEFLKKHFDFFNIPDSIVHLDALTERGWLQKEQAEGQKPFFKMHPLIGDVVVEQLGVNEEFADQYIQNTADSIYYKSTNIQYNFSEINKKRIFAERLSNLFINKNTENISELLDNLGYLDEVLGLYYQAAYFKERALKVAESVLKENHPVIAVRQSNLANTYNYCGRYEESITLLKKALSSDLKSYGDHHEAVATRLSNLAMVYRNIDKYEDALELLVQSLKIDINIFGEDHPKVAIRRSNLADIYDKLGKFDIAIELFTLALKSDLNYFGKENSIIDRRKSNLAAVYLSMKDYQTAATILEEVLPNDINNFGLNHPRVANRQNNLALAYWGLGRYDEAKHLWRLAHETFLQKLGPEHINTINIREKLEM